MSPSLRGALSRVAVRVVGSRFAKPAARAALVAAGLVLLALIGRAGAAGVFGASASAATSAVAAPEVASSAPSMPTPLPPAVPLETASAPATASPAPGPSSGAARGRASADDPVILNTATTDDLRRLPGVGEKRAGAILALRARLGRFRAIEDLLKVKGVGRAMLKRIRPLVRLDPAPAPADAGATSSRG